MNIGDLASQIDYNSTEDCGDFFEINQQNNSESLEKKYLVFPPFSSLQRFSSNGAKQYFLRAVNGWRYTV